TSLEWRTGNHFHVARARYHHGFQRHLDIAVASLSARCLDSGSAGRRAAIGSLFRRAAGVNFFRRLLSEGALNSAFVPIWLKRRPGADGAANANRFAWRVLLGMFCIAGFIALLVIFIAPGVIAIIAPGFDRERHSLAAFLLFMVAPYFVLVGLVAVIAAALNAEGRGGAVALRTILFNLALIVALSMFPRGPVD